MSVFSNDEGIFQVRADKARRNRLEAIEYLKNDYRSIAQIMGQYYPPAILSKAVWHTYEVEQKSRADEMEKATARLFPVLLQSIFLSKYFDLSSGFSARQEIKDKDWDRLVALVDDASRRYMRLIDARAIVALDEGLITRDDFFPYREALFSQLYSWQMTEKELEESHELFRSLFTGDEEICNEVFKTDPTSLLDELYKISTVSVRGIDELVNETRAINSELRALVDAKQQEKPQLTRQLATDEVLSTGDYRARLQRISDKANSYELFSVEYNSLLSTAACTPLSATAGTLDDVIVNDRLAAVSYPFIRFADRFYTFTGPTFHSSVIHAMRRALTDSGVRSNESGNKLEKLYNNYILYLFRGETDGTEDYYTYRDLKADVVLLSSMKHMNAYRYPGIYATRRSRRMQEEATRSNPGRVLLLVDPDGTEPLKEIADKRFTISLSAIASICASDKTYDDFFVQLFKLTKGEEDVSPDGSYSEAFVEDDVETTPESFDVVEDDIPAQVLLDDEMEYDSEDDDEKAREIEARFDQEDMLPDLDEADIQAPHPDPDAYELPEELKEEQIVEELEDIDDEDLILDDDEAPEADDDLDVEEEEEEAAWQEIMPMAFDDDEIADEDEENPEEDDQLSLFDEDGNPAVYYPDDELADLDTIEEDTSEIRQEDGPTESNQAQTEQDAPSDDIIYDELDDYSEDADDLVGEDGEEALADSEEDTSDLAAEDGELPPMEAEETPNDSEDESSELVEAEAEPEESEIEVEETPSDSDEGTSDLAAEDGELPPTEDTEVESEAQPVDEAIPEAEESPSDSDGVTTDLVEAEDQLAEETISEDEDEVENLNDSDEESSGLDAEDGELPLVEDGQAAFDDSPEVEAEDVTIPEAESEVETPAEVEEEEASMEADDITSDDSPEAEVEPEAQMVDEVSEEAESEVEEAPVDAEDEDSQILEEIQSASEEEEADEADDELPPSSEDDEEEPMDPEAAEAEEEALDSLPDEEVEDGDEPASDDEDEPYDPEKAEAEEAALESAPSEETEEAEEEAGELVRDYGLESGEDDEDTLVEDEAPYGAETAYSEEEEKAAFTYDDNDDPQLAVAADGEKELVKLPEGMRELAAMMDKPLPALEHFISEVPPQTLDSFEGALKRSISAARSEGRDKMLVIPDYKLSFVITASDRLDALRKMEVRNNAGSQMYARGLDQWSFALLSYNSQEKLSFVYSDTVTEKSFTASDWKIVRVLGEEMKRKIRR